MATRRMVCIIAAACVLSACGGPVVTLKNPQSGELASCKGGAAATGVASDQVADGLMTECVDGYTRQGLRGGDGDALKPPPAASPSPA